MNQFVSHQDIQDMFKCGIIKANEIKHTVHDGLSKIMIERLK